MPAQTVIKLRRDTAANWASVNPILAAGEAGLETDTGLLKYGNGTSAWAALSYPSNSNTTYLVRNNTGATIPKGTLVAATGAEPSGRIDVAPFEVTGLQDSELRVMGIATANIASGVNGTVMSFGTLTGIDTRGSTESALAVGDETWAAGDILYAHPTVDGKLTNVRPQHDLAIAFITVRNATAGQISIRIVPGNFHLEWLHDVDTTDLQDGYVLAWNESESVYGFVSPQSGPEGADGAGYAFPLKEADPEDPPLPDPVSPDLPTPGNDGRIEWALEAQSLELYGEVGAYKVGDYVQIGSTSDSGKYMFGTVGEIQDLALTTERMIIAIQDSMGDGLPYLTNQSRTVSLAARKNPGYRLPLVPLPLYGAPIFPPLQPTWPDFGSGETWDDVASDNEIQLPGSLVGDYKVGDYVRLYSDEDAPGVYYLGTVIEVASLGTQFEYLTVVIQDAVGDQFDFSGLTNENRRLSIEPRAGEDGAPGADGEAGQGLLYMGDYNYETTYNAGDVVATAVGASGGNMYPPQPLYVSLIDNNLDNDPSSSPLAWSFLVNRISDDGWLSKQNVVSGVSDTEIGYLGGAAPVTSNIQTQINGKANTAHTHTGSDISYTINDKSANYTIVAADEGRFIRSTGSAITITVADVFAIGEVVTFTQYGAGQVTFAPAGGVTLHSVDSKRKTNKQYSTVQIMKTAAATYLLFGDITA